MKKSIIISQICVAIMAFSMAVNASNTPTENILKRQYQFMYKTWTDQFSWKFVTVATEVAGLIKSQNVIDSVLLNETLNTISKRGGGVLFFPKGTYFINYSVVLPQGVILRGEVAEPQTGKGILTKFEFPKYVITPTPEAKYNTQTRVYESSIVRKISVASGANGNIGLIDLDINRGLISFKMIDNQELKNILILNVTQNNVALPDPQVPSAYQIANDKNSQRWTLKSTPNIEVIATKNVIVANTRLNEKITDNIPQTDYLTNDGMMYDGYEAVYKFTDHTGIIVELTKTTKGSEIQGNYVRVTEGNQIIQAKGFSFTDNTNDVAFIKEKQNLVQHGLYSKTNQFAAFERDNVRLLKESFFSKFGDTLNYSLVKPHSPFSPQKYPLIVFLEAGYPQSQQNGDQLKQFVWQVAGKENAQSFPCFTLAPQLPKSEDWWKSKSFSSTTWTLRTVIQIIDSLAAKYPIDKSRIYLVGVGLGSFGAWDLAQRYPEKFAALVPISSFYRFVPNSARQLKDMPIWMIWGDSDEYMPLTTKQFMKAELKGEGIKYKHTEIPNTGNRCWTSLDQTVPDLFTWMFQQRKH